MFTGVSNKYPEENDQEGDEKEVYTYSITIEVKYTHPRTNRCTIQAFIIYKWRMNYE